MFNFLKMCFSLISRVILHRVLKIFKRMAHNVNTIFLAEIGGRIAPEI
jgi:hypothetical protein